VVGRVIQGAGGGIFPLAFGIVRDEFPAEEVPGSIGILSSILGVGGGVGIVLGGLIIEHLNYHWLYWIPLVVSIGSLPASVDATHAASFSVTVRNTGTPQSHPSLHVGLSLGVLEGIDAPSGWQCTDADCTYTAATAFKNRASASFTVHMQGPDVGACDSNQSPAGSGHCMIAVTAETTDDTGLNASASGQIEGVYPDLSVTLSGPADVAAGARLSFSAVVSNSGSGAATGVVVRDSLPALASGAPTPFVVYEPAASSSGCGPTATDGVVVCSPGALASGGLETVVVSADAPVLAAYANDSSLIDAVAVGDNEEGSTPLTPEDDSAQAAATLFDAFQSKAAGGSSTKTPGISSAHPQQTVVTLASSVTAGELMIDDSLSTAALGSDTCPTSSDVYGNPVIVTAPKATVSSPNTVQLIYSSGPGGIPANEALGAIQVTRQDTLGDNSTCVVLPQCGLIGKKSVIPSGAQACIVGVKRQTPTGLVTITLLDSGGDPTYRGGG
jgi:uncharacterized repeat protein (TIGR01451 family)